MHDEKRPKWRKAESGCGAPAMQERSPDSRDRGCVDAIAPSADRETETQDGLNSTQNCSRLVLLADPSKQTLTQRKITSAPAAGKQSQDTITTSASKCVPTLQLVLCPISGSSGSVDSLRRLFCYLHTDLAAVRAFNHRCSKCLIWCAWKRPVYAATVPPKDLLDAVWKLFHHFLSSCQPLPLHLPSSAPQSNSGHPLLACSNQSVLQPAYINLVLAVDSLPQPLPAIPDLIQRLVSACTSAHLGRVTDQPSSLATSNFFATPPIWKTTRNASRRAASPVMLAKVSPQCNSNNKAVRVCVT